MVKEFQPHPHTITVNSSILQADRIIIAAGSIPVVPALPGIEAAITSGEILFLPVFPRRLVIVGAGVSGLEMAGAFSDFGAEVVVVGQDREILPAFDPDVAGTSGRSSRAAASPFIWV